MSKETTFGPHVKDPIERKTHRKNIERALLDVLTPSDGMVLVALRMRRERKK